MINEYTKHAAQLLFDESAKAMSEAEKLKEKKPDEAAELEQAAQWLSRTAEYLAGVNDVTDAEQIDHIKEALANDAPNDHAEKALKKYFGASMSFPRAFSGIRVQTHTQKHLDAQNNSWAFAQFGKHGDLTAAHLGAEGIKEAISSAGAAANGVVKVVERIIEVSGTGDANSTVSPPDPLDKALLYPLYRQGDDAYVAVRPITPVWHLNELYKGMKNAAARKLAEAVISLKHEWEAGDKKKMPDQPRIFTTSARVRQIANPSNNGPLINGIQGYVVQGVLLPPSGGRALADWIAKSWQDGSVDVEALLKKAVIQAVRQAGIVNRIAHQMHRHHGDAEIKGADAPENAGVRQLWIDAGALCATELETLLRGVNLSVIKDEASRSKIQEKIEKQLDDWKALRDQAWNAFIDQFDRQLTSRWKTSDWKAQFYKGFEAGVFGHKTANEAQYTPPKRSRASNRAGKEKTGDAYRLRIWLDVEAMDAGSFAPTLGLIPLTAVWGALHKWIERDGGGVIDEFKVGASKLRLLDRISGSPVFASSKFNGKAMKKLFESESITSDDLAAYVAGPMVNCVITQKSHTGRKTKVEEPLMGEVRMSGQVLIDVELSDPVDDEALSSIVRSIEKSRFNGGFIRDFKVRRVSDGPVYGYYALSAVDLPDGNPLEEMFYRLIRSNVRTGNAEPPFGFVQAGWQFLDVPSHTIHRNGGTFDWQAAEPVWKALRWLGWNNENATWWRVDDLELDTDGQAIGVMPR